MNKVNSKPQEVRILIFGHKEFSQLMTSVLPEFGVQAKFKLFDAIVGSVSEIDEHISSFLPDVIVSAGSNAAYLKSALDLPVVSLDCSVTDIISAVQRAAQVARSSCSLRLLLRPAPHRGRHVLARPLLHGLAPADAR